MYSTSLFKCSVVTCRCGEYRNRGWQRVCSTHKPYFLSSQKMHFSKKRVPWSHKCWQLWVYQTKCFLTAGPSKRKTQSAALSQFIWPHGPRGPGGRQRRKCSGKHHGDESQRLGEETPRGCQCWGQVEVSSSEGVSGFGNAKVIVTFTRAVSEEQGDRSQSTLNWWLDRESWRTGHEWPLAVRPERGCLRREQDWRRGACLF